MKIKQLPLGPLQTNCYVVYHQDEALIFDPGGEADKLIDWLKQSNVTPKAILLTHAHFDHIGAVDSIRDKFQIPVYIHPAEKDWLSDSNLNGSSLFPVDEITMRSADHYLEVDDYTIGNFHFEVRHTPGHSPGGVAFIFNDEKLVVGGDSLFFQGIGRTDLPGGNYQQLVSSIKNQILTLPDSYAVYPGHGPKTTVGAEREQNPFIS